MAKKPKLVPGEVNILTGKELTEMGYYFTVDRRPIATTLTYEVELTLPRWTIRLCENKIKQ